MKTWYHKITAGIILVAIVAMVVLPPAGLLFPKKAEAQGACIGGLIAVGISKIIGGIATVLSIPVSDVGNMPTHTSVQFNTAGVFIKDCIIIPLVKSMVKAMIHQFLMSIVDWINSGFDGSGPRFVSDPESFFADVVDKGVGQMIYGSDLKFLCSPFALDIRLALGLNYWGGRFRDRITCTLSDVIGNITSIPERQAYRNSWQSWLDLTTKPQNNPYGAFALAKSELEIRIANKKFVVGKEIDWGSGFLTTKRCIEYDTEEALYGDDPRYEEAGVDPCVRYETVTPGKLVSEGVAKVVGSQVDEYVAAEDIDAIFGALFNQMIGSIFSASGIFSGTTRNTNYYRNKFESDKAAGVFNVGSGVTAPTGFSSSDCSTNYVLNGNIVSVISDTATTPVTEARWVSNSAGITQSQVYSLLTKYCSQLGFWNNAQGTVDNTINNLRPPVDTGGGQTPSPSMNIALKAFGGIATQSATYLGSYTAEYANDGGTFGGSVGYNSGIAVTRVVGGSTFWELDLSRVTNQSRYLEEIVITPAIRINGSMDETGWTKLNNATVSVYGVGSNAAAFYTTTLDLFTEASSVRIPLCAASQTSCQEVGKIRISRMASELALAELEAFNHPRPTISVTAEAVNRITVGGTFEPLLGVVGKDFKGETDTVSVNLVSGAVDTNLAGPYTLTYVATDLAGVPSNPLTRTVIVGSGGGTPPPPPPPPPPL